MSNPIITENLNAGTTAWKITQGSNTQIQAYGNATSFNPGDTVNFFVSTQSAGTTYSMNIYRLGYYGGKGACLKASTAGNVGVAQGYWDLIGRTLNNCPTLLYDATTHLTEAGWASTDSWTIPNNACTGIYAAIFQDQNGYQWGATFVVRGNSPADYAYVRAYTTEAGYNDWGGYSLYTNPQGVKTSFNRPNTYNAGVHNVYQLEIPAIQWLEQQGYNLSYLSNVDVQVNGAILLNYKAYLTVGHDEYWTYEMRAAVESARNAGVGLGFFGGNDCYWQMRLENDHAGTANRTVVCYKVGTFTGRPYSNDPLYGVDNTRVTTQWRDTLINRPESQMMGSMFSDFITFTQTSNFQWTVGNAATSTLLNGTGLVNGASYGTDCVGNEWDKVQTGSPGNIQVIGASNVMNNSSQPDISQSTTYVGPGGALVFAAGSICWTWCLGSYRWLGNKPAPVPQMQILMANIMGALKGPVFSQVSL